MDRLLLATVSDSSRAGTARAEAAQSIPKAVPVRFGRLGNFRPGSRRFEAPNVGRIPDEPLVSCLCVTENRHSFMPWLLWGYDRQAWKQRELVIVDSSDPPVVVPKRSDIRVLHVPPGTSLGKKRNIALDAARGGVVAWFDDDDWQHPRRLSLLVPLLREYATRIGASFIGPSRSYFLDVGGHRCEPYHMGRYAIFNGSVYYTKMVSHARFPEDVLRTEDTRWISTLLRKRQGAALVDEYPCHSLWLCHAVNVTNANHVRKLPLDSSGLIARLGSAWGDTQQQLAALRSRLSVQPARRAVRVALAEPLGRVAQPAAKKPDLERPAQAAEHADERLGKPVPSATDVRPARAVTAPEPVTASKVKLGLYLVAGAGGTRSRERSGFSMIRRGGWERAVTTLGIHKQSEWSGADYVGVFDAEAVEPPESEVLARAIGGSRMAADVYVLQSGERISLRKLLALSNTDEAFLRQLLARLPIRGALALDRTIASLQSGWVARPEVFGELVRKWLVPARATIGQHRDPAAIFRMLASIAFSHERRTVRSLDLERSQTSHHVG
jgi:glycosyltransferase involved in cell wall biosynthesis